jgi:hypothetical protein
MRTCCFGKLRILISLFKLNGFYYWRCMSKSHITSQHLLLRTKYMSCVWCMRNQCTKCLKFQIISSYGKFAVPSVRCIVCYSKKVVYHISFQYNFLKLIDLLKNNKRKCCLPSTFECQIHCC